MEVLWTPLLGPTQVILLHRLAEVAVAGDATVAAAELAFAIGTRGSTEGTVGRQSPLCRAIERLIRFRLATWTPDGRLAVRTEVPALGDKDVGRLPNRFREVHRRFVAEQLRSST